MGCNMNDYRMYAYISEPVEFRQLEGKAVDFRKTFDLRGHGTDEMLQLYLRKANLSDDLERLPALQRRAYVYDIIRSHKGPGYWVVISKYNALSIPFNVTESHPLTSVPPQMPPSMQVNSDVFAHPPPAVRPPPQKTRVLPDNSSGSNMSNSSSSNSLHSYGGAPPAGSVPGPSFATSVVVSNKGSKYEISGPINFQHVSGDVTRDRTRNAFDLNANANDNVLKKYMMERGITEDDIRGMKRHDVVKKIIHSNFTWMPTKQEIQAKPAVQERPLLYATISTNNQITPPSSPPAVAKPAPAFSNYASLTSRFVDISDMDMEAPEAAQPSHVRPQETGAVIPVQVQQQPQQIRGPKVPPPPSAVRANNNYGYPAAIDPQHVRASAAPIAKAPTEPYATIAARKAGTMRIPPPAPPKPTIVSNSHSNTTPTVNYAVFGKPSSVVPPPPQVIEMPKKVNPTPTSIGAPPPPPPPAAVPPPPSLAAVPPPPPPIQMSKKVNPTPTAVGVPPPPPPMQIPKGIASSGPVPVPPPPPPLGPPTGIGSMAVPNLKSEPPKAAPTAASAGGDRDAFLESIRMGVKLKKVDQKAATISGIKPRAERKPPTTDFLSELKLGITLRRVKNPADNPYSQANTEESQA